MYSIREIYKTYKNLCDILNELTYQLISEKKYSLETEFTVTEIEKILQAGTEQVQNHGVVVTFGSEPPDEGNTDASCKSLVYF